jgi:hypothetical protein
MQINLNCQLTLPDGVVLQPGQHTVDDKYSDSITATAKASPRHVQVLTTFVSPVLTPHDQEVIREAVTEALAAQEPTK